MIKLLKIKDLYNKCDTSLFTFKSTKDIKVTSKIISHDRALAGIDTALGIKENGFNLFVMGEKGRGKHSLLIRLIKEKTKNDKNIYDWIYLYNFTDYDKPLIIKLKAGQAKKFKKSMSNLVSSLKIKITQVLKSKKYLSQKDTLEKQISDEQDVLFNKVKESALKDNISISDTSSGITISPVIKGKLLSSEEFNLLSLDQRDLIDKNILIYQDKIDDNTKVELELSNKLVDLVKDIDKIFISYVLKKLINPISEKYAQYEKITSYLKEIESDILEHYSFFIKNGNKNITNAFESMLKQNVDIEVSFDMYNVNILVNNENLTTVPIIYEDNPRYANLFGRIDHVSHMGTITTDFNLIKAGSLHKANGGYLIIDALSLLSQPNSWEALKRMLKSSQINLETIEESMGFTASFVIEPQSVDLDVKVILIGSREIYSLLYSYDEDFKELFKIEADFENKIKRNNENILLFINIISNIINERNLLPVSKKALGKIIEFSSRLCSDSSYLSSDFAAISDLLQESNYVSSKRNSNMINLEDILNVLKQRVYRKERIKEEVYSQIKDETIQINTKGEKIGHINGLAVIDFGNYSFCIPMKISCLTKVGKEGVVTIEREVELSGSIHSKGVLIISSYLASRYAPDFVLSLSASLVFEQSYSMIDGDSASLAELYALLSSISKVKIKQNFAITGSINQSGDVQAIGGVNEKIEGFFDVCKLKDKNFESSVIIPFSNIKNLMLKEEVLEAVKSEQFKIYAIKHIDEGVKLLMGMQAGKINENGKFPKNTLNYLVNKELKNLSKLNLSK